MRRFATRHRLALALASSLALALMVGGLSLLYQVRLTAIERDAAIAQSQRAEALSGLLLDAFEAADPSRNSGKELRARDVLDQAALQVQSSRVDSATRSALLTSVADVYHTLGLHEDSAAAARQALAQPEAIPPLLRARALRALAQAQLGLGQIDDAETSLGSASGYLEIGAERDLVVEFIEQERVRANIMLARGSVPEALETLRALYTHARDALGAADPQSIRSGLSYAQQLRIMRQPEASLSVVSELLVLFPNPQDDPVGVRLLGEQSRNERALGRTPQALAHAHEYVAGMRRLFGEQHRSFVGAIDLLAKLNRDTGKFEEAIELYRQALERMVAVDGDEPSATQASVLNNLSVVLRAAGESAEAIATATQAVSMAERTFSPGHTNVAHFVSSLAEALIDHQNFSEALVQLDKSEAIFAAGSSPGSTGVVRAFGHVLRAQCLLALGRNAEASAAFSAGWPTLTTLRPSDPQYQRALDVRRQLDRQE